jgi:hypothetical protein
MHVDLTLAINYIPACTCLGKVLVFMLALAAIPENREVDGLVLMAGILYVDRIITRNIIFDANAILLAIYFSNVHAAIRATRTQRAYRVLEDSMFLLWAVGSLLLIYEPQAIKRSMEKRPDIARLIPVALMLIIVVAMSHIEHSLESAWIRTCRATAFTLLSFAWICIVGVRSSSGIEYLKDNSCQFVSRLAPALYAPIWVSAGFSIGAIGSFVCLYSRIQRNQSTQPSYKMLQPEPPSTTISVPPSPPSQPTDTHDDIESLEAIYRQARLQAAQKKLDPILETL